MAAPPSPSRAFTRFAWAVEAGLRCLGLLGGCPAYLIARSAAPASLLALLGLATLLSLCRALVPLGFVLAVGVVPLRAETARTSVWYRRLALLGVLAPWRPYRGRPVLPAGACCRFFVTLRLDLLTQGFVPRPVASIGGALQCM